jgi:hypothetical protein
VYAGTETGVYVSFDDGARWQSLRLDMPVVSVRDLVVHGTDLVIATHGRAFWVLDDIEPLRALASDASSHARLFPPRVAIRTREGNDEAEASPPETPLGENPPNGAFIDYVVPPGASGPLTLDIVDGSGDVVRHYASDVATKPVDPKDVPFPPYWIVTPQPPSALPGMHRIVWDFHIDTPDGPLAAPGTYAVRLVQNARTLTERLILHRDPRVAATDAQLVDQTQTARAIARLLARVRAAIADADAARATNPAKRVAIDGIAGVAPHASPDDSTGSATSADTTSLRYRARLLDALEASVESADTAPTPDERAAFDALREPTLRAIETLRALR